jgi:acetolactate synthase-1/3 small subunit
MVLEPFGLIEFVRSARVAIIKKSDGFHSKLKEFEYREPSKDLVANAYLNENEKVFSM